MPTPDRKTLKVVREILSIAGGSGRDLSFDIYCPKTYAHHNRLTYWMPVFYLDILDWT